MGMARLFFHAPRYGVLDECTNATSVDVEEALFEHAARLGITLVTITQRTALVRLASACCVVRRLCPDTRGGLRASGVQLDH
jgi:ABC-type uncharacterized transport system fused permease/ATPase subunit